MRNFKSLASFCDCAGRFESYLVGDPEGRFSRDVAQIRRCISSPKLRWQNPYASPGSHLWTKIKAVFMFCLGI